MSHQVPSVGYLKRAYQSISHAPEATSGGSDRSYLDEIIFGHDPEPQTLLDIGSNLGYFCLEAAKRGWTATGMDTDPRVVDAAIGLASGVDPRPDYLCGDFEKWEFGEQKFDVVIALNVLHHMFDPIHALKRIQSLARRRIVLEVAQPTWRDRDQFMKILLMPLARKMPIVWLDHPRKANRIGARTFLFTAAALKIILSQHTMSYGPPRFHRSPFKGRLIAEAQRREVGRLVIIAGPTSSGKSTFQKRFLEDLEFRKRFVPDEGDFLPTAGTRVLRLPGGRIERVLVHYDFMRPLRGSLKTYTRDPILDLMRIAEQVTVITIAVERSQLVRQIEKGELRGPKWRWSKRHVKLRDAYQAPGFLDKWYASWFEFCTNFDGPPLRQILVENRGEFVERSADSWPSIVSGRRAAA